MIITCDQIILQNKGWAGADRSLVFLGATRRHAHAPKWTRDFKFAHTERGKNTRPLDVVKKVVQIFVKDELWTFFMHKINQLWRFKIFTALLKANIEYFALQIKICSNSDQAFYLVNHWQPFLSFFQHGCRYFFQSVANRLIHQKISISKEKMRQASLNK